MLANGAFPSLPHEMRLVVDSLRVNIPTSKISRPRRTPPRI